jgi:hypothetical protein
MNYERYRITGVAILLLTLCTTLLIGRGLEAQFAGGDGPKKLVVATMNDVRYQRGSIVTAQEPGILYLGDERLFLDLDTQIELVSLNENDPVTRVIKGRAVLDGQFTVITRETRVETNGQVSFVHYSWLDELDLGVISGTVQIQTPESTVNLETGGLKIKTLAPYTSESIPFAPETSSAKAFYAWVASMSPPLLE